MQLEMYNGGTQLFFDLFVAMCNNVDDVSSVRLVKYLFSRFSFI